MKLGQTRKEVSSEDWPGSK